jgi:hypothetical protein
MTPPPCIARLDEARARIDVLDQELTQTRRLESLARPIASARGRTASSVRTSTCSPSSGASVRRTLRTTLYGLRRAGPQTRVLYLADRTEDATVAWIGHTLAKPFSVDALVGKVRGVLGEATG